MKRIIGRVFLIYAIGIAVKMTSLIGKDRRARALGFANHEDWAVRKDQPLEHAVFEYSFFSVLWPVMLAFFLSDKLKQ